MLSQAERNQIIDLINREVVPAIGCTEPIAVALCTARAAETLGGEPEKITVRLTPISSRTPWASESPARG